MTVRSSTIRVFSLVVLLAACGRAGADDPRPATPASVEPTHVFRSIVPTLSAAPGPCPSATSAADAAIGLTFFDGPGGGCIAPDQLRGFRCDDRVDPVIEAAGLRFLGGRFAMVADGLPANAALVGRGGGEEVYIAPGDRPTLFVRTPQRIERWLTLAERSDGPPQALFLGDSITVGSRGAIVRAVPGWGAAFRAQVGRTTAEGADALRTLHDVANLDAVVVELGTNESKPEGFPNRIQEVLSQVDPARLVVWVTVHREDLDFVPELNDDIVRAMAEIPNGAVADWAGAVTPDDLVSDGVHPSDAGKKVMGDMLGFLLNRWEEAASGHGALACAPPLD